VLPVTQPSEAAKTVNVAWKRVDIADAGISIDQHPEWATLQAERLVYQRFSNEGTVSVRWGDDATIDDALKHTGIEGGSTRTIESDQSTTVDGMAARRVQLRVISAAAHSHDVRPSDRERIFVFVGFKVGHVHVLVGYRSPVSELAAVQPLLEHVLASVKKR
jgi:hypothetical protein